MQWLRRTSIGVVAALVLGVVLGLSPYLIGAAGRCEIPGSQWLSSCRTFGSIIIGDPQVFTRERLVNDRLREEAWLTEKLDDTEKLEEEGRFSGFSAATNLFNKNTAGVMIQAGAGAPSATPATSPPDGGASGNDAAPPAKAVVEPSAPQVGITPGQEFRVMEAYREEIRDRLMETQLDDRHDLKGNTLLRLSFNATILGGNPPNRSALIFIKAMRPTIDEANPTIYTELLEEWRLQTQQLVDEAQNAMAQQLTGPQNLDMLRTPEINNLRWYLRERFIWETENDVKSVAILRKSWPRWDEDYTWDPNKPERKRIIERAQILFSHYLKMYEGNAKQQFFTRYRETVAAKIRQAIFAVSGDSEDGMSSLSSHARILLEQTGFCEGSASMPSAGDMPGCYDFMMSRAKYSKIQEQCQSSAGSFNNASDLTPDHRLRLPLNRTALLVNRFAPPPPSGGQQNPAPNQTGPSALPVNQPVFAPPQQDPAPGQTDPLFAEVDCPPSPSTDLLELHAAVNLLRKILPSRENKQDFRSKMVRTILDDYTKSYYAKNGRVLSSLCEGVEVNADGECLPINDLYPGEIAPDAASRIGAEYFAWKYNRDALPIRRIDLSGDRHSELASFLTFQLTNCTFALCRVAVNISADEAAPDCESDENCSPESAEVATAAQELKQAKSDAANEWSQAAAIENTGDNDEADKLRRKTERDLERANKKLLRAQYTAATTIDKTAVSALRKILQADENFYAYALSPREIASNEFARAEEQLQLWNDTSVRAAAPAGGQLRLGHEENQQMSAAKSTPTLISFALPAWDHDGAGIDNSREPSICREIGDQQGEPPLAESQNTPASCFGWIIRPPAGAGGASGGGGTQRYPVAVILSVPSWWKVMSLTVWSCWIRDDITIDLASRTSPINDCAASSGEPSQREEFNIRLPGSARELARKLGPQILKPPYISATPATRSQTLLAGRSGILVLEGERLWKSPVVVLGDQRADGIQVLPNMKGIMAEFKCVRLPSSLPIQGNAAMPVQGTITATVWTSEGITAPFPVTVKAVPDHEKSGDYKDCRKEEDGGLRAAAP